MAKHSDKKSDLRQALDLHLRKVPADAPLRTLLASPEIEDKLREFDAADATAIKEQRSYRRLGRFALRAMMVGALIGALALLPLDKWIIGLPRRAIEVVQALALVATFIAVMWSGWRQSVGQWMRSRAEAERLRADVFRALMQQAAADANRLLSPALACFKDAHLDWQLGYYRKRGREHRRAAGNATPYKIVAYLLTGISVVLGIIGLVNFAAELGFSLPHAASWIRSLAVPNSGRWQLGLGAMASSILAFASARSFMDQDDRNASCYELAAKELERLGGDDLPRAEAAAREGRAGEVLAFCERVQAVLSAEHLAWIFSRPREALVVAPSAAT
jgi:hypothetical protein